MNGADWLLDALAREGARYLFGNPGSTELPLVEALGRQDRIEYVLCLHEAAALGMADGYAQATGEMAAVNVHVQPGMANALSGILNARRARVPILVTVGQQATKLLPHSPFLGGEIVGMGDPLAKAGWEPTTPDELARDFRLAVKTARTPPIGPAVLSLPLDLQVATAPKPHRPEPLPDADPLPADVISAALTLIKESKEIAILAGDGVVHAGAGAALGRLADSIGAPVFGEPYAARAPLSTDHPLWRGPLPGFAAQIREDLSRFDLLIALGMPVFRLFGISPGEAISTDQSLIHVDADPEEIGRSFTAQIGVCAEPDMFLNEIIAALPDRAAPTVNTKAHGSATSTDNTISPSSLCAAIAEIVGPDDIVVDEALTAGRGLRRALIPRTEDNWFAHRGSALGWGLPAGVGVALAKPNQRVLVVHGDGSVLFGLSALWTAAHMRQGLAMIIADNRGYEILRAGMEGMTGEAEGPWPGLKLSDPRLDLEALCAGYGASVETAVTNDSLRDGLSDLWRRARNGPAVLIAEVPGHTPAVGYPLG